jgi:hypothetical protein
VVPAHAGNIVQVHERGRACCGGDGVTDASRSPPKSFLDNQEAFLLHTPDWRRT